MNLSTLSYPHSATAEAYQSLRANIEFTSLESPLRTLLIAGIDDSVDKSVAVANLAVVMAEAGDRVLIVDGDLRQPQQHTIFDLPNHRGLSNWLAQDNGSAERIPLQETPVINLNVLTSGPIPTNPVALLGRKRLIAALQTLRKTTDYILCDAPPVINVTDASLWASNVEGVVLLVNAGATRKEYALRAKALLEKAHANIIGAVILNAERDSTVLGYKMPVYKT